MNHQIPQRVPVAELTNHIGFWLRFVSNHVSQAFARRLLCHGVTPAEWVVLRKLYETDSVLPSELATRIGMTRGAASKLIDRLAAKQLVTRKGRTDDRRYQDIALTAAGQALVPALASLADQNDEEFFKLLTPEEKHALVATLKKLVQGHRLQTLPTE